MSPMSRKRSADRRYQEAGGMGGDGRVLMISLRERWGERAGVLIEGKSLIDSQCGKENFDTLSVVKW